jgi:hypothetical protein
LVGSKRHAKEFRIEKSRDSDFLALILAPQTIFCTLGSLIYEPQSVSSAQWLNNGAVLVSPKTGVVNIPIFGTLSAAMRSPNWVRAAPGLLSIGIARAPSTRHHWQ